MSDCILMLGSNSAFAGVIAGADGSSYVKCMLETQKCSEVDLQEHLYPVVLRQDKL